MVWALLFDPTNGQQLRRQPLYPTELPGYGTKKPVTILQLRKTFKE
jgi:hypothetical protein